MFSIDPTEFAAEAISLVNVGAHRQFDVGPSRATLFDDRRGADCQGPAWHRHVVQDNGVCGHDRTRLHHGPMEHDCPGRDLGTVTNDAALQVHHVPDHTITAHRRVVDRGRVHHCAVLNTRPVADHDDPIVSAENSPRPHRTLGSDRDGPDDHRVGVNVGRRMNDGDALPQRINGHGPR